MYLEVNESARRLTCHVVPSFGSPAFFYRELWQDNRHSNSTPAEPCLAPIQHRIMLMNIIQVQKQPKFITQRSMAVWGHPRKPHADRTQALSCLHLSLLSSSCFQLASTGSKVLVFWLFFAFGIIQALCRKLMMW